VKRFLFPLLVLGITGLTNPVSGQKEAKNLIIKWQGHSLFEVTSTKGTRLVIDPHNIPEYNVKKMKADLIFVTHQHDDHNQVEMVENYDKAKIFEGIVIKGKRQVFNPIKDTFKDFKFRTVKAFHDNEEGAKRGPMGMFVFEVDGFKFAHLGDLGHELTEQQVKEIGPVDFLMIPVGGIYTINGSVAKEVVKQLKPTRYIFPMHYGNRVYDSLLPLDEFLEGEKKGNIVTIKTNEITIEPTSKAPDVPKIIILNWEKPE
jgi:L-ascorbate metabolism protein UlaG (beta-lactamase superfamily)